MRAIVILIALVTFWSTPAHANLARQMDSMFGSLVNVTPSGAYKGQQMGAFFGGSVYVRNRITNMSLIGFVPPHVSAGCGGIDMFGGSFSFINAAQFKQLLRSIASNAGGYFFQIALQAMCPTCLDNLASLQKKVQQLNQLAGNSCMAAKALVDTAVTSAIGENPQNPMLRRLRDEAARDATTSTVAFTDTFSSLFPSKNKMAKIDAADPKFLKRKGYVGNIVWMLMKHSSISRWFAAGDQDLKETLMSLVGTIVVHKPRNTVAAPGGTDKAPDSTKYPPILTPEDLVYGSRRGNVRIYRCGTDPDCMAPTATTATGFVDFTTRIKRILLGVSAGGTGPGLVAKYAHPNARLSLSPKEQAFAETAPAPILAMIRGLAQRGESTARKFANNFAAMLAREMAYRFTSEVITAIRVASDQTPPEWAPMVDTFETQLGKVEARLFNMKRDNFEADQQFLAMLQTYNNLTAQHLAKDRIANRLKPDANNAARK